MASSKSPRGIPGRSRRLARTAGAAAAAFASVLTAALATAVLASRAGAQETGPGLGNLTYSQAELFKHISIIRASLASSSTSYRGMNSAFMFKGYLFFGYGRDSGNPGGGFAFYDVSDPRNPRRVAAKDVADMRESHAVGFHVHQGRDYVAVQTVYGIHIWDVTNIQSPVLASDVRIPGVSADDYSHGAWWLTWQAPFIFVSRGAEGFSVVDASTPTAARLMNVMVDGVSSPNFPITKTGNFEIGPNFAVGNLLIATTHRVGGNGLSAVDISDPRNPRLLATASAGSCYSTYFNGGFIYCNTGRISKWEVGATTIRKVAESPTAGGSGEYLHVQDNFVHAGVEDRYAKIDIANNMSIVNNSYALPGEAQEGFANPFGNLVLLTDDHSVGSAFVVHQTAPDKAPPVVNFVSPANGSTSQKTSSRIGVTFTDQVNVHSVNASTFIVRPLGGQTLSGRYSAQTNIVNFTPDQPLQTNTTYEVVIPRNGIKDYSGNATGADFTSRFSTGSVITPVAQGGRNEPGIRLEARRGAGRSLVFSMRGWTGTGKPFLTLYHPGGRLIRETTLAMAGGGEWVWDGRDEGGRSVPAGLYLARLRAKGAERLLRVLLP